MNQSYELIDSGEGLKLEQFGQFRLVRPCAQAMWPRRLPLPVWNQADAVFSREGGNRWQIRTALPKEWVAVIKGVKFKISPTDFGHVGVFPEHSVWWEEMDRLVRKRPCSVLNLFAYSGGATLAAARAGAKVCHLDASKGMVGWARENAALNQMEQAPIRWIVDDVMKFLQREEKRGVRYDGIILDPPSFGRGSRGEIFKIESDLLPILRKCRHLLSDNPLFVFLTTHTPGMTPLVMHRLLSEMMGGSAQISSGELVIGDALPSGCYAKWTDE